MTRTLPASEPLMAKVFHHATHQQMRDWSMALVAIEQELHRANMHVTAHAVNRAVRAIGWEFTGDVVSAGKASRGEVTP